MKKLNILDLHRTISQKNMKRVVCFDKVLEICHKKIVAHSENKKKRFFFEVPDFMLGQPLYDVNDCIKHILEALKNNGFLAIYYFPRHIYVSWDFEEIDEQKAADKKAMFAGSKGQTLNKNNVLDFKYKPSGKLTLDL